MLRAIIIFAALLLGSIVAEAQPTPLNGQGLVYNSFTPYSGTNVITLSLSAATSGNAALGITSPVNTPSVAWVQNTGSNPANVILGVGNTLTASLTTGTYLGAGTCVALNSIGATYIAGYSTLGTTLTVTMGVGNPAGSCGGAGSSGGGGGGGVNVTPTDCSGTITSGGTAQNAITAQTTLHGFVIQNIDASAGSGELLWISFTGTAAASTAGSYELVPPSGTSVQPGSFATPSGFGSNHAVSIIGATTGHKFSCTWW